VCVEVQDMDTSNFWSVALSVFLRLLDFLVAGLQGKI
jgi:hypothetical protein